MVAYLSILFHFKDSLMGGVTIPYLGYGFMSGLRSSNRIGLNNETSKARQDQLIQSYLSGQHFGIKEWPQNG